MFGKYGTVTELLNKGYTPVRAIFHFNTGEVFVCTPFSHNIRPAQANLEYARRHLKPQLELF